MSDKPYRRTYTTSENFYVKDTIGVPHPYMITDRHVSYAATKHGGMLSSDAIKGAEKHANAKCDICKGQLSYEEHEQALIIGCKANPNVEPYQTELREFLKENAGEAEKHGYAGFTLLDQFSEGD